MYLKIKQRVRSRCPEVFLKFGKVHSENICPEIIFLIHLLTSSLQLYFKRGSDACLFSVNFKNILRASILKTICKRLLPILHSFIGLCLEKRYSKQFHKIYVRVSFLIKLITSNLELYLKRDFGTCIFP